MLSLLFKIFLIGCQFFLASSFVYSARIKDLTDVRGSRSNQLYGYGIVTGLAGQGDSRIEYTELGVLNALETLGIRADKADKSRNIAAVMVTADIGPFAKEGSRMDVTVSSIGNADSLQGVSYFRLLFMVQMEKFTLWHGEPFPLVDYPQEEEEVQMFKSIIRQLA